MDSNRFFRKVRITCKRILEFIVELFAGIIPDFMRYNFYRKTGKARKICAIIVTAVFLTLTVVSINKFSTMETSYKWLLFAIACILPFVVGLSIAFSFCTKSVAIQKAYTYILLLICPLITITMTECLNNIFIYNMTYLGFIANYILTIIFYFIVYSLCGSMRVSIIVNTVLLYGFALAHAYVMDFRGTPFIPMDFLSISTAAGVANTYDYSFTPTMIIATEIFVFLITLGIKTNAPKFSLITKIISRSAMGIFSFSVMIIFFSTSVFADMGIKPDFWNQSRGYKNYGFAFSFFCNTRYLYMSVPNGYDPGEINDLVSNTIGNQSNPKPPVAPENAPNIICIMNESLSDLSVLGNLETNEDYMPFMRNLTENTIKGNLYVPVIGAGTSNTEFEFLTGHSTAFLPSGSNAYMLYVKDHIGSMVSTLEGQGYSSLAFHPYYASGWNRISVYNFLGFDLFKSLENLFDVSLMDKYVQNGSDPDYLQSLMEEHYPDRNMLLRQYVSDSYNYQVLIEDYKNRDTTKPFYAFNVTMQNHGGYTSSCVNFDESIYTTSTSKTYKKVNKYLSLVKESDNAFKELIDYFKTVKEPTVICMFGDHQPSVETNFIEEMLGVNDLVNLSVEQEQKRYTTPFFIWANYDIEEKQIERLSVNYLHSMVLDVAGVQLTEYNKYLLKLSETLPVINTAGYIDNQGNYYRWSDSSPYTELLSKYERIQYNNIFDRENIDMNTFYLPGYVIPEIENLDNIHAEGTIK